MYETAFDRNRSFLTSILFFPLQIAKDARECVQECVSEFISFITSEASDRCHMEKRKTINGEDILFAMTTLGFDNYVEPLKLYLQKYREATKSDKVLQTTELVYEDIPEESFSKRSKTRPAVLFRDVRFLSRRRDDNGKHPRDDRQRPGRYRHLHDISGPDPTVPTFVDNKMCNLSCFFFNKIFKEFSRDYLSITFIATGVRLIRFLSFISEDISYPV